MKSVRFLLYLVPKHFIIFNDKCSKEPKEYNLDQYNINLFVLIYRTSRWFDTKQTIYLHSNSKSIFNVISTRYNWKLNKSIEGITSYWPQLNQCTQTKPIVCILAFISRSLFMCLKWSSRILQSHWAYNFQAIYVNRNITRFSATL